MSITTDVKKKSIEIRFIVTFIANAVRSSLNFVSGLIVARTLGPDDYGSLNFLLISFTAINRLLDMGTSTAFYTFISRKKRSKKVYMYYAGWMAAQFIITVVLVYILVPDSWIFYIWAGHDRNIVLLAFISSFTMNQLWNMLASMGESIRNTLSVQIRNVSISLIYTIGVVLFVIYGLISIKNIILYNVIIYISFSALFYFYIKKNIFDEDQCQDSFKVFFAEYKVLCIPLVVSVWTGFLYTFVDNWFLQSFGGSVQQGFYSVGERFSAISLIATTSMLQVFWKEIAEAEESRDYEKIRSLFTKVAKILFFVAAFISCYLVPFCKDIIGSILGPAYAPGWISMSIMFIYPTYQSLGQISGTFLYATGRTGIYRNIVILTTLFSVPISYFVLAPGDALIGGLELGAAGMALKIFGIAVISSNVQLYIISKLYGIKYEFMFQFISLGLLLVVSYIAEFIASFLLESTQLASNLIVMMLCGFLIYAPLALAIIYFFPSLLGIDRERLILGIRQFRNFLQGNHKNLGRKAETMKILVIGGAGFLGSHVADALTDAGHEVAIYDIVESAFLKTTQKMIIGDILDEEKLTEALESIDVVYHFAGIADIDEAANRPVDTIKYNVLGTSIILAACIKKRVKRIIFASTVYVYSNAGSFYRVSKQSSELLIEAYNEKYGLDYTILRYGSLYGPRADLRNGIYRFLYQAVKDGEIQYYGDGEEVREYIHILDAAKLSTEILAQDYVNQNIIITGQQVLKARDLLTMIREMLNNNINIKMVNHKSQTHYQITPYNFGPKLGRKMVSNVYIDMGQGLLQVMSEVFTKVHSDYEEKMGYLIKREGNG